MGQIICVTHAFVYNVVCFSFSSSLKYLSQVFDIRIELDIMMIITMLDGGGQRGIMVSCTNTPFLPFAFALFLYHVLQQPQTQCPEMVMLLL